MALTEAVKEKAIELGFGAVGVAAAERLDFHEQALRGRMAAGGLEGLSYFTPERAATAADPRALLPEARAVVSLALPMALGEPAPAPPLHGAVARYAWGRDYHRLAQERLKSLVAFIHAETGAQSRAFVDATPLLERAFASQAGLGWFGKNNCLITPGHGSWVALADVVTEAALTPDGTQASHSQCGDCVACLRNCPTGALVGPFAQWADRCLSFLTTELRGPVPRALRPLLGTRVLGCDSCQSICPKNADKTVARPSADEGGLPPWLDLTAVLALDERAFAATYGGTAALRAKRAGLLRNAAVAMGNTGNPNAVAVLTRAIEDPAPLVRGHVAWSLGRLGGQLARRALEKALGREMEGWVREEIDDALGCAP